MPLCLSSPVSAIAVARCARNRVLFRSSDCWTARAPGILKPGVRQLDGGKTLAGARDRVADIFFGIDIKLGPICARTGRAHIPLLLVRRGERLIADGDEYVVNRLSLALVARIDIAEVEMAPILRKHFALFEADIAFLGKTLDGIDIAVINLRAFCLVADFRFAVFRDADAVAPAHGNLPAPAIPESALSC